MNTDNSKTVANDNPATFDSELSVKIEKPDDNLPELREIEKMIENDMANGSTIDLPIADAFISEQINEMPSQDGAELEKSNVDMVTSSAITNASENSQMLEVPAICSPSTNPTAQSEKSDVPTIRIRSFLELSTLNEPATEEADGQPKQEENEEEEELPDEFFDDLVPGVEPGEIIERELSPEPEIANVKSETNNEDEDDADADELPNSYFDYLNEKIREGAENRDLRVKREQTTEEQLNDYSQNGEENVIEINAETRLNKLAAFANNLCKKSQSIGTRRTGEEIPFHVDAKKQKLNDVIEPNTMDEEPCSNNNTFNLDALALENIAIYRQLKAQKRHETVGFLHTSTMRKLPKSVNFYVQEKFQYRSPLNTINNVEYEFNSTNTIFNYRDWGIEQMSQSAIKIAKIIGMDADTLYEKMKEFRKKTSMIDGQQDQQPSLEEIVKGTQSNFYRSAMTQTEESSFKPKTVLHDFGVQVDIEPQATNNGCNSNPMCERIRQLDENQLFAIYDFLDLIEEDARKPMDIINVRQQLISIWKSLKSTTTPAPVPPPPRNIITSSFDMPISAQFPTNNHSPPYMQQQPQFHNNHTFHQPTLPPQHEAPPPLQRHHHSVSAPSTQQQRQPHFDNNHAFYQPQVATSSHNRHHHSAGATQLPQQQQQPRIHPNDPRNAAKLLNNRNQQQPQHNQQRHNQQEQQRHSVLDPTVPRAPQYYGRGGLRRN